MIDLDVAVHAAPTQTLPERCVLYLVEFTDAFDLAVCNTDRIVEKSRVEARHREVGELIDRAAEHSATVSQEVLGVVGPSTEETDAKRGLADDHRAELRF